MTIKLLLIIALVFPFFVKNVFSYLNIRLKKEHKSKLEESNYLRKYFYLSLVKSSIILLAMLAMIFFDIFGLLDAFISGLSKNIYCSTILYLETILLIITFLRIPLDFYSIFVIEQQSGINNSSKKLFFFDTFKGLFIQTIMSSLVLIALLFVYNTSPTNFWWQTTIIIIIFQVLVFNFFATYIIPIFNKTEPILSITHKNEIYKLTKKLSFDIKSINTIDQSKRSNKANAYFVGLGRNKRIIIYDTLVKLLSPKELSAIIAHEIGHNRNNQFYYDFSFELLKTGLLLIIFQIILLNNNFFPVLGFEINSFHASSVLFFMLSKPIIFILDILNNIYSRYMEHKADYYATKNFNGIYLEESLKKISNNNLLDKSPIPIFEFMFYSHPSIENRIRAIKKYRKSIQEACKFKS